MHRTNAGGRVYAVAPLLLAVAAADVLAAWAAFDVRALFLGPLADHSDPAGFGDLDLAMAGTAQCVVLPATAVLFALWFRGRDRSARAGWTGRVWWASLALAALVLAAGTWRYASATTVPGFVTGSTWLGVADALNAAVALFGILYVRRLTPMQGRSGTGMIPAAQ
ncbi:hypothetical protein ACGF1Z_16800 [Streptomyces sp. NPDC048018]|uniref:hypothetical protein n=1 Tax=Streptomyces sp. NPDC048018 TaxID=3365499 RepID=UPI003717F2EA